MGDMDTLPKSRTLTERELIAALQAYHRRFIDRVKVRPADTGDIAHIEVVFRDDAAPYKVSNG